MLRRRAALVHNPARKFAEPPLQPDDAASSSTPTSAFAIRAWLVDVMRRTDMKPTPLAKAAGLAPSTLLRALDPDNPGSLERRSIDKIVQKFGVEPPAMYGQPSSTARGFAEPEMQRITGSPAEADLSPTQGIWKVQTRALELAGYLPGDELTADSSVVPRARDVVVAQILDHARGTAETVLRVYEPPYLLTETTDERARQKPQLVDNDRVAIWGVVVRLVRVRR